MLAIFEKAALEAGRTIIAIFDEGCAVATKAEFKSRDPRG